MERNMKYVNEDTYKRINEAIIGWKYYNDFEKLVEMVEGE